MVQELSGTSAGYFTYPVRPTDSAATAYAVTKSDTIQLNPVPRGLYIGTGGNVTLRPVGSDTDVTYKNVPNGGYLGVAALFIRESTTAADIIAEV